MLMVFDTCILHAANTPCEGSMLLLISMSSAYSFIVGTAMLCAGRESPPPPPPVAAARVAAPAYLTQDASFRLDLSCLLDEAVLMMMMMPWML